MNDFRAGTMHKMLKSIVKIVLAATLFVVLASYVAVPCFLNDSAMFAHVGAAQSCQSRAIFRPMAEPAEFFRWFVLPAATERAWIPVLFLFAFFTWKSIASLPERIRQRLRRGRIGLALATPFLAEHRLLLPYFAAQRDA